MSFQLTSPPRLKTSSNTVKIQFLSNQSFQSPRSKLQTKDSLHQTIVDKIQSDKNPIFIQQKLKSRKFKFLINDPIHQTLPRALKALVGAGACQEHEP